MKYLLDHLDDVLSVAREFRLGVVVDFDGTISEIAPTPEEATIAPACASALDTLATEATLVAVLSGRSAEDVQRKAGLAGVVYVGNHGAEYLEGTSLSVVPGAEEYRALVGSVFAHIRASADGPGLSWQDKGLTASVHYRTAPDEREARRRLAAALDSAPGAEDLEVFWGKMVLELRSPLGADKGYALRRLAEERRLAGMFFLGDDVTDVDGVRSVKRLTDEGRLQGIGIAVAHHDSPEELLEAADYALKGVDEVGRFLQWLVDVVK